MILLISIFIYAYIHIHILCELDLCFVMCVCRQFYMGASSLRCQFLHAYALFTVYEPLVPRIAFKNFVCCHAYVLYVAMCYVYILTVFFIIVQLLYIFFLLLVDYMFTCYLSEYKIGSILWVNACLCMDNPLIHIQDVLECFASVGTLLF